MKKKIVKENVAFNKNRKKYDYKLEKIFCRFIKINKRRN